MPGHRPGGHHNGGHLDNGHHLDDGAVSLAVGGPGEFTSRLGQRTLASRLARTIELEIIRRGWPVGEGLGSEAQLMERYQVGRSVLREAVRLLESRWVARPRPGPGGGLVVTAPDHDGVRDVARVYLDFARARPEHLCETWSALEAVAVRRLSEQIDTAGLTRLRGALEPTAPGARAASPRARSRSVGARSGPVTAGTPGEASVLLHLEIARLAGNPAAELFIRVLADLAHPHDETERLGQWWQHPLHAEIVDAITRGEGALAEHLARSCIRRHVEEATAHRH
ncbi:DNA-binding transcriptional regulator, FadR family [Parafrankia irregularis]|uniref:DNA-binding transcriptional regulator, FadR family n=1 Tax=Parafrankia irregularis TaxID=795642 RepID=A0A0S4QSU2_9ACTN|nr:MULTISPECIES: FCD domain-containing protein [Frankiaceae]CUU57530.1 DNA-binding transcriptional regulator, FadR family [Parafrankia irregularis]